MAETAFSVAYDGPALATGRMPVRDLAPALLALGDIFTEASTRLYPDRPPVALNIRATREGSFIVQLILESGGVWDDLVDIFGSDAADALANLTELVVAGGTGLFWLTKRLRGRRIIAREDDPQSGQLRITLDDQTFLEVPAEVLDLYNDVEVDERCDRSSRP